MFRLVGELSACFWPLLATGSLTRRSLVQQISKCQITMLLAGWLQVKFVSCAKTDKILGAHVLGTSAGELIHEVSGLLLSSFAMGVLPLGWLPSLPAGREGVTWKDSQDVLSSSWGILSLISFGEQKDVSGVLPSKSRVDQDSFIKELGRAAA